MYKIGISGAHGTGKTTLVQLLAPELNISKIDKTMRNTWESFSVTDFEKLPADARSVFQNYLLLNQINREDEESVNGFIADRSVVDILAYTISHSNMSESELSIFEHLVKERLKCYTHLIYTPIEFEVENEYLRANIDSRERIDSIIKSYIDKWIKPNEYLEVHGSIEYRMKQIREYLKK